MLRLVSNPPTNHTSFETSNSQDLLISTRRALTLREKLVYTAGATVMAALGTTLVAAGLFATPCYLSCFLHSAKTVGLPVAVCSSVATAVFCGYLLRDKSDSPAILFKREKGRKIIEIIGAPTDNRDCLSESDKVKRLEFRNPMVASKNIQIFHTGKLQHGSNIQCYIS